jgi:uncharacterized protein
MIRVIRSAEYPTRPWKNGGGQTRDICMVPPAASLDDFVWRISLAQVDRDGPFSRFANVDRTLVVLSGAMTLRDGERLFALNSQAAPFVFAGEQAITATLDGESTVDFNVMTRRGRARHSVRRAVFKHASEVAGAAGHTVVLFALEPGLSVEGEALNRHDTAIIGLQPARVNLPSGKPAAALVIDIVNAQV